MYFFIQPFRLSGLQDTVEAIAQFGPGTVLFDMNITGVIDDAELDDIIDHLFGFHIGNPIHARLAAFDILLLQIDVDKINIFLQGFFFAGRPEIFYAFAV